MSDHKCSGYNEEQRRDDGPCERDTSNPSSSSISASYGSQEDHKITSGEVGRRSITSISKDVIRTFQTTMQGNNRSNHMMPQNSIVPQSIQPKFQKLASEGSRLAHSVQHSAQNVNDKLGNMLRRSSSPSASSLEGDRGIYASQSARQWGSNVSAEISTFATQKVVPLFKRQNTYPPTSGGYSGYSGWHQSGSGSTKGSKDVSFDYVLMKDNE